MEPLKISEGAEPRSKEFKLTTRDMRIIRHIAENRFATADQIKTLFWKSEKSHRNHYRRLHHLKEFGLIDDLIGDRGVRLGYRLTAKGMTLLRQSGVDLPEALRKRVVYRSTFQHDKILNDLRPIFESSPLICDYQTEAEVRFALAKRHGTHEKRGEGHKVPDGIFRLKTRNRELSVAIELELSQKAETQYRKIMRQLSTSRDFQIVFFIAGTEKLKAKLEAMLADVRLNDVFVKVHRTKLGFYFITLENLLRDRLEAKFEGEGQSFSLGGLATKTAAGHPNDPKHE